MPTYGFYFQDSNSDGYSLSLEMVSDDTRTSIRKDQKFEDSLKAILKKSFDYSVGYYQVPYANKGGNKFLRILKKHGFEDLMRDYSVKEFDNKADAIKGVEEVLKEYNSSTVNESKRVSSLSSLLDINESLLDDVN